MPTYVVKRTEPLLVSVTVEAANPQRAREAALYLWLADTQNAAMLAQVGRQPQRPDDTGDARSEARYEYTDDDARDDAMREHRWGLGGSESPREGTEA